MKDLVSRATHHDADAFTELIQGYMKDMYKVAIAIVKNEDDAGDAIQETILNAWEKIGTLKENKYFKTWLIRILINNCYAILKAKKPIVSLDEVQETGAWDNYGFEMREALSRLPEKYTTVLVLYYGQGFKAKEIAEILNIPLSTVQTRMDRARKYLRDILLEDEGSVGNDN